MELHTSVGIVVLTQDELLNLQDARNRRAALDGSSVERPAPTSPQEPALPANAEEEEAKAEADGAIAFFKQLGIKHCHRRGRGPCVRCDTPAPRGKEAIRKCLAVWDYMQKHGRASVSDFTSQGVTARAAYEHLKKLAHWGKVVVKSRGSYCLVTPAVSD